MITIELTKTENKSVRVPQVDVKNYTKWAQLEGWTVETVDGKKVWGFCQHCNNPIFDGEAICLGDGCYTCETCRDIIRNTRNL